MPAVPDIPDWGLIEKMPFAALLIRPDFTVVAVNEAYTKATGLETRQLLNKNFFNTEPLDQQYAIKLKYSFEWVLRHREVHEIPLTAYNIFATGKDMEKYGRQVKNSPVLKGGHCCYIIHSFTDVSCDENHSRLLKNKEKEFEFLVEGITDHSIFLLDTNGAVASWNTGAQNMKGYTAREILGKPLDIFYTDEDIYKKMPAKNLALALQKKRYEVEGWRLRKDGSKFYARIVFHALTDARGTHYGYAKVTRDITEQREDARQNSFLEGITKTILDPVISCDNDFIITRWNEAAERIFGWTAAEAIGLSTITVLQPQLSDNFRVSVVDTIGKYGYWQGEVVYHSKKGNPINGLVTVSQLKDDEGKVYGNLILIKDVTPLKQAEQELEKLNAVLEQRVEDRTRQVLQTEEKYHRLFDNNPLPMWVIAEKTFRFLDVNHMACFQYGYTREEFLSMTALDIRPDEDRQNFISLDRPYFTNPTNYNKGVWQHRKKDGSIIKVQVVSHEIMFEGMPCRLILANDISEKFRAEEQLAASEKQLRHTLNNMLEGAQILDFNWRYTYVNDALVNISQYTREELLGSTFMERYPGVEKTEVFHIMQNCMTERVSEQMESRFVFPDGTVKHFQLSIQPVPEGLFVLSIDITERIKAEQQIKESEENLKSIFENVPEGFLLTDVEGIITVFNKRVREYISKNVNNKITIGDNIFDFVEAGELGLFKAVFAKVTGGEAVQFNRPFAMADNEKGWIRLSFNPVRKAEKIVGICVAGQDITNLRRLEAERMKQKTEEQQKITKAILHGQEKEKNHIAREMHDNINQILAGARMYLSIAASKNELVKKSVKYPIELLDETVKEIRLLTSQMVTPLQNVRLEELLHDLFFKLHNNTGIITSLDIPPLVESITDELKLNIYRIVQELSTNIIKYAEATRVTLQILINNKSLQLQVSDNGKGFDVSLKKDGIGLSNMRSRVESFGGKIEIISALNKGTQTNITIPVL